MRKIERHAENIDDDTLKTFQQIYNNLAGSVSVSEVYIVPASIEPDLIDQVTGKPEEPIIMFDELIINGGQMSRGAAMSPAADAVVAQPEIERHEYLQYKEQFAWLREHVPTEQLINGLKVPVISGPEIITCDNTIFNRTLNDGDRRGLTFAVPFYGGDGKLRGSVVAIILSQAIKAMLPASDYALVHSGYGYASPSSATGQERASSRWVTKGEADPGLVYSEVADLTLPDAIGTWRLWVGHPDSSFFNNPEMAAIATNERLGYGLVLVLTLAALGTAAHLRHRQQFAKRMVADRFELLGQITAKVSHELRNPLSAVRNSVFIMRRKSAGNAEIIRQTERAERGIIRCDQLISDLLEYTRDDKIVRHRIDICHWLEGVMAEQSISGPVNAVVTLPEEAVYVEVDPARLRRAVLNIFDNAVQSISSSGKEGQIKIACKATNERVTIEFRDDGPGIPADVSQLIFNPLFTTRNFAAGLGLPIAKSVIESHDGELSVVSTAGHGACFTITLPRSAAGEMKRAA